MTAQRTSEHITLLLPADIIIASTDCVPMPSGLGCSTPEIGTQVTVVPVMLLRRLPRSCRVKDTYDSTKAKIREYAGSVEPHNDMEAIKSSGGIPSNTADLVRSGVTSTCS